MGKRPKTYFKLTVTGIAQGVGFRPYVARLAALLGLNGYARNTGGAVEIFLITNREGAENFAAKLSQNAPPAAAIHAVDIEETEAFEAQGFTIADSTVSGGAKFFPPDLGLCKECEEEILSACSESGCARNFGQAFRQTMKRERGIFEEICERIVPERYRRRGSAVFAEGEKHELKKYDGKNAEKTGAGDSEQVLSGENDRRGGYWFNSCVNCGPRYTIMERFPYDRANTSMKGFALCEDCAKDYNTPQDRRFRAETVCCKKCKEPELIYYAGASGEDSLTEGKNSTSCTANHENQDEICGLEHRNCLKTTRDKELSGGAAFNAAEEALRAGKIIAVKGIGGYHFICRADAREAVHAIRELKNRDTKPFARMFYSLEDVERICEVSPADRALLESPARPIVLLIPKNALGRVGAFLPYTPLHKLLIKNVRAVVATSLNRGNAPIIKDDGEALAFFHAAKSPLWAGVLYNNRPIIRRAEDSVAEGRTILRRARGYAPLPLARGFGARDALALGGDLKAAFAVYTKGSTIVSPYLGDVSEQETFAVYKQTIEDLLNLFEVTPGVILADAHPRYFTHAYGAQLAARFDAKLQYVNHHHAHIASVMAEHGLTGKVLGVAFDGAGYGTDGAVWGGEFLLCEGREFKRFGHLEYVKLLGSDSAARDALKTAECYLHHHNISTAIHEQSEIIRAALKNDINVYQTSSMGRLFDAAAALIGLGTENTYEGECAMALQYAAEEALRRRVKPVPMQFEIRNDNGLLTFGHRGIIERLAEAGNHPGAYALGFHMAMAEMVYAAAQAARTDEGVSAIALSGGVFQNRLLREMIVEGLEVRRFSVYVNEKFPPNDGGICVGQILIGGGH